MKCTAWQDPDVYKIPNLIVDDDDEDSEDEGSRENEDERDDGDSDTSSIGPRSRHL